MNDQPAGPQPDDLVARLRFLGAQHASGATYMEAATALAAAQSALVRERVAGYQEAAAIGEANLRSTESALTQCRELLRTQCDDIEAMRAELATTQAALKEARERIPREPTEAMVAVAEELDLGEDQWDYATIWRAMYDAALKRG